MLKAEWRKYELKFLETAITSRSQMEVKDTFVVRVWDDSAPEISGFGECALFRGLSAEDNANYERLLSETCRHPEIMPEVSSIRFGLETALADLRNGGKQIISDTPFTHGERNITINGLIWMGDKSTMQRRIEEKLAKGFRCIKLKIGGINFEEELELLHFIRSSFSPEALELRLDANGAFSHGNALERLKRLSDFSIHSIEQPIRQGQAEKMTQICESSPIPIALDEELIGFRSDKDKRLMLDSIRPQFIILKPALCGGFREAEKWIAEAEKRAIGWWATSALESNVGLNAIAQWVSTYNLSMPQGLGTGALYANNVTSPLRQEKDYIRFEPTARFENLAGIFQQTAK